MGRPPGVYLGEHGGRIKSRLGELGWSQQNLADEIGLTREHVTKALNNQTKISLGPLGDIARALAMEFPDLLPQLELRFFMTPAFVQDAARLLKSDTSPVTFQGVLRPTQDSSHDHRELRIASKFRQGAKT